MLFCVTTYALAPVAGFGWLIATMGLAQCRPNQRTLRVAYITVFLVILCIRNPLDRRAGGLDPLTDGDQRIFRLTVTSLIGSSA